MMTSFLVPILAFIFAFSGIIYEYLLAYFITGIQGGGYTILFLTFSFFAAFLGCGAVGYNFVPLRFRKVSYLGILQVSLGVGAFCVPLYFEKLSISYLAGGSYVSNLIFSLIPVSIIGFVTGFELPFLYDLSKDRISRILFWDYSGMFVGIILFPFLLIGNISYTNAIWFLGGMSFFVGVLLLLPWVKFAPEQDKIINSEEVKSRPVSLWVGLSAAFLLSFSSFAYQGLIGKVIISYLGDNFRVQAYAIGFFIIGMALGALLIDHWRKLQGPAASLLVKVETGLCVLGAITPVILYFMGGLVFIFYGSYLQSSEETFLGFGSVLFSIFSLLIGTLTGMELPLLFRWMNLDSKDRESYWMIGANYSAAIFAGLLISYLLPRYLGHSLSFVPVVLVNVIVLMVLLSKDSTISQRKKVLSLVCVVLAVALNAKLIHSSRQFFIDVYYSQFHMSDFSVESWRSTLKAVAASGSTERIESFFQNIDLRTTEENAIQGRPHEFSLYLNKQPQFNSAIIHNYHQSMSFAAASFIKSAPQQILVLGGGDGLLAGELLKSFPQSEILLVELDPEMIDLSKNNSRISNLNEAALENPRVRIEVGDAYSFIRRTPKKFDLVFVDFPYPTSVDLSRLYSFEFYQGLRGVLSEAGVAIIDAPILINYSGSHREGPHPIVGKLLSTFYFAGFKNPFCFGPFDPFVAVAKDNRTLEFSEEALKKASNSVFVNLRSLHHAIGDIQYDEKLVNKVLSPTILEM